MKRLLWVLALGLFTSCGSSSWNSTLPPASELSPPAGYSLARTIIHLHSPYSFDACDKAGLNNGTPDATCLSDLRWGLCANRIDFAFLTDHPSHMAEYTFNQLLLEQSGDTIVTDSGNPVANQMGGCSNGQVPTVTVGFEDEFMALAMKKHVTGTADARKAVYEGSDATTISTLKTDTSALVFVPHTEKRDVTTLAGLSIDGVEIYNFHSNLDPKIRQKDLGMDPFTAVLSIMPYVFDPFGQEKADLAFLSFYTPNTIALSKWESLIYQGKKVAGIGASDSHQNVLSQKAHDGERLDSHRRLLRWASNHFLVTASTFDGIRDAVSKGRGWLVFEALGSPVGMDFYATAGASTVHVGETGTYSSGNTTITVKLPSLHSDSPHGSILPRIIIRLYQVTASGHTQVAYTYEENLTYTVPGTGIYRAEVSMIPRHLEGFMVFDQAKSQIEYPWVVTNPIYLE